MYLAVRHMPNANLIINTSLPQASVLCLPSAFILYLPYQSGTNQELLVTGKRDHSGLRAFVRSLCLNGTNCSAALSTISVYSWT